MTGLELTSTLDHIRLEAEQMKQQLKEFEGDALALQGSIFTAVALLVDQLRHIVCLLDTGQAREARFRLLQEINLLEAIGQDRSRHAIDLKE